MPRMKMGLAKSPRARKGRLTERLANELKANREFGQPLIYEHELSKDKLRVVVIWDEWDRESLEERTDTIFQAYELAEGVGCRQEIALASGLTVPEAAASGMLPYQVATALRKTDPVTFEQCWKAMEEEGASKLMGPDILQLRFATQEEAEACRHRLIKRLPMSDDVWLVSKDAYGPDFGGFDDSE